MDNFLFTYKVNNFNVHKYELINLIKKIPLNKYKNISHTDWNLPPSMERKYFKYFLDNIFLDFGKQFCKYFNCEKVELINAWFQVYKKGDLHFKHTHPNAHFTNVFYLNLPHQNLKTKITLLNKKKLDVEIEEGCIASFPAFYTHESPINNFKNDKIIISFNTNLLTNDH